MWRVLVGNLGEVHTTHREEDARMVYATSVIRSIQGLGKAALEPVTLMQDGEIKAEHNPDAPKPEHICLALGDGWFSDFARARKGRVTVWHSTRGYLSEHKDLPLMGIGDTPQQAHKRLLDQLKVLVEQIQEAL